MMRFRNAGESGRRGWARIAIGLVAIGLGACTGPNATPNAGPVADATSEAGGGACVPGLSVGCIGPLACAGYQVCNAQGTAFDPCVCGAPATDASAEADATISDSGLVGDSSSPVGTIDVAADATGTDAAAADAVAVGPGDDATGVDGGLTCTSPCGVGQKMCNAECVGVDDPDFGCSATSCTACSAANATAMTCSAGACAVATCVSGTADCDHRVSNGCESNLDDVSTCGSCNPCGGGKFCRNQTCVASCDFPETTCSGTCRDLSSDSASCGSCGYVCPASAPTCQQGSCACTTPPCPPAMPPPCCSASYPAHCHGCNAVCDLPYAQCGSACVALQSDANNCGTCGKACAGSNVCVAGQCVAPASVQWIVHAAFGIAVDVNNIYFTDPVGNAIYQADKTTGVLTPLGTNQAKPWRVAVDGSYVYWTSNLGNAVLRAAIGGAGSPQVLYSTDTMGGVSPGIGPTGIAVDGENVYWSSSYGISAAPKAGNGAVRVLQKFTPDVLEQDDTHLYAVVYGLDQSQALSGTIAFSVAKSDGAFVIYAENLDPFHAWPIAGVAIGSGEFVYEQNTAYHALPGYPGSALLFMTLGGASTGGTWLPPNISSPRYLVIDGCHGFVTDTGTIYRFTFDGQAVYPVTTLSPNPLQMVVDDTYLYWVDGSGFIGRVPK